MEDIDIWRAARQMIVLHGEDAWFAAAQRADHYIARGDPEGERVWKGILRAVEELQRESPVQGQRQN